MKTVAVFLADDLTIRRLTHAFRERCNVRAFTHAMSVQQMASSGNLVASIVDMRHRTDLPEGFPIDTIARLHSLYPVVPVVGYVDFTPQRARDILSAAHAGATDLILREVDDLDVVASRISDMGCSVDVASRVEMAIKGLVPAHLHEFFLYCIRHACNGITVEGVTARLRRNRKTLSNWLATAQLPPPYRIIGWMRILVAARLLEDQSRSLEKVARELRFVSGAALRNMLRRYLDISPDILRQKGGFEYVLPKFIEALQGARLGANEGVYSE